MTFDTLKAWECCVWMQLFFIINYVGHHHLMDLWQNMAKNVFFPKKIIPWVL
jgi:hypothetical protein